MQITSQQHRAEIDGRAITAVILGALSLLPCLWILGPGAYLVGTSAQRRARARGQAPSGLAQAGRVLGLAGSTFLLLVFVYAVATIAGVIASPR